MAKFKVSAPGRIYLSGEHTKMYEKYVVTAGLNLRTTLTFSELPDENIDIKFPDVKLSLTLSIEQILNFFYDEDLNLRCNNTRRLLEHVQFFITSNGMWSTYEQKHSLQIFLFLLLWSSKSENFDIRPFHVHVTTQLPMNAGFGSSTSFAVCLAGCFLHWSRLQKGNYNNDFDNDELLKIVQLVMACEEDEIDYACMIDQLVCAFGEIMLFRCQHPTRYYKFLHTSLTIDILLIDSKIRPNKYAPMLKIAKMKHTNSANTNHLLDLINTASIMTYHTLHEMSNYHKNNNLQKLTKLYVFFARLFWVNQLSLSDLGLSNDQLHTIYTIAQSYGYMEKLTGLGHACILLPLNIHEDSIESSRNISDDLIMEGFAVTRTSVNCDGVRIDLY